MAVRLDQERRSARIGEEEEKDAPRLHGRDLDRAKVFVVPVRRIDDRSDGLDGGVERRGELGQPRQIVQRVRREKFGLYSSRTELGREPNADG